MRVGTTGRLDGQLTPALRNFILSHSTGVYETSYHPVQVREGLMKVSFGDLAGENDELLGIMRNACLRRDPWAPIYIMKLDLDNSENRRDLSQLRARLQSVAPKSKEKEKITGRIQYIRNSLEKLLIEERRREYFENLQQGKTTTHLVNLSATNPRPKVHRASSLVAGCLARFFVDETSHTALSKKLVK
ncbi:hypothetical protein EDB81DRAFT_244287 [Dactylonectria macrodidyma]|uniref:Uncharacterized protein n=1 Tax=Dactylonectria macrodidyma TaxID=307937 RepID=A0A9P9IE61_9HYPO|nr:hypothetical protein EDB81DRAFT_244287 [Dactylonectria macrodidyma]